MLATIRLEETEAKLRALIEKLAQGDEVAVMKGTEMVARIVGARPAVAGRPGPGLCQGMITINADDEDHLKDFAEYMP